MLLAQNALLEASEVRGRPRRTLRLAVDTSVAGDTASTATIHNISETGLLLQTDVDLPIGEWISVDLPGAGSRPAQVVWESEHLFGCRFYEPVTPATVSAALLRAPFDHADQDAQPASASVACPPVREDKMSLRSQLWTIVGLATALWAVAIGLVAFVAG